MPNKLHLIKYSEIKELNWEDDWKKYIQYGSYGKPLCAYRPLTPDGIIDLMCEFNQCQWDYTVYDAFLKATEIKASSRALNRDNTVLKKLIFLKEKDIKNIQMGIFDEGLKEYIASLERGYQAWLS